MLILWVITLSPLGHHPKVPLGAEGLAGSSVGPHSPQATTDKVLLCWLNSANTGAFGGRGRLRKDGQPRKWGGVMIRLLS